MAVFNPDVAAGKDGVPDYTKQTKPVDSFIADKSTGIALATLGEGLGNVAGIAEFAAKEYLDKDIRNRIEPIREEYTNDLLKAKAIIQGVDNQTGELPGTPRQELNLLPEGVGPTGPVPAGINAGLRRVDRIQNMMLTGGGKIAGDDTYYDMRLKNEVISLRKDYPGFVNYIDQRVAAITGMNPANELVKDLTRQLAQLQTNKKTEYDKALDLGRKAMSDGLRDSERQFQMLRQNGEAYVDQFYNYYATENRKRAEIEERDRVRASTKADREEIAATRTQDLTNRASAMISTNMDTLVSVAGVSEKKSLLAFIEDAKNNPNKYSAEQLQQLATSLVVEKARVEKEFDDIAGKRAQAADGRWYSYNSDVGSTGVQTIKKDIISSQYDAIDKALTRGDAGLAFSYANRIKRMLEDDKARVYAGPAGKTVRLMEIYSGAFGPNWTSLVNQKMIQNAQDKVLDQVFENTMMDAKLGNPKPDGKPITYNDMAGQSLSWKQSGQISDRLRARYLESGLDVMMDDITNTQAPVQARLNALKFFFSKEGQGVLRHFNDDRTDEKGVYYPGKQSIWNKFSSDAVINEVKKLSALDARVGIEYRNWMEREAAVQLYSRDFKNLNGYLGPEVFVTYNDGEGKRNPTITLMSSQTKMPLQRKDLGQTSVSDNYYNSMQASVNRINSALAGMDRVYKGLGEGDASDQLLTFLLSNTDADITGGKWTGISEEIINAIAATRGKGKLKDVMEKGVK